MNHAFYTIISVFERVSFTDIAFQSQQTYPSSASRQIETRIPANRCVIRATLFLSTTELKCYWYLIHDVHCIINCRKYGKYGSINYASC